MLLEAIGIMTIALVLYTIALIISWKKLKPTTCVILLIAVVLDVWGTIIMYNMAEEFSGKFHAIAGIAALSGMIILLISPFISKKINLTEWSKAYKYIFCIWIISYFAGMAGY